MLLLGFFTASLTASDAPKAVIVFDASGSMWGQIHGKTKIEIARDALKSVVKEWNPNVELGLTVYGHRTKGDCNDIETVIPVGKVNKQQVIREVMDIQPKGKTPISRALRKAANDLRYTEEKATIILISDGKETCDPDPCGTAKQLKKEGIDFVTHVIGFNVDKKTDEQLACIAHATGGEYFSAKNAKALNKAIKTVAKKVEKAPPPPKETVLVPVVRYDVFPDGLDLINVPLLITQDGKVIYEGDDVRPELKVKVGKVHIKAVYSGRSSIPQTVEKDILLKAQERNFVKLLIKSGSIVIDAAEEKGGPKVNASAYIFPVINGEAEDQITWCVPTKESPCKRILPIGDFIIKAEYNSMKTEKRFSLSDKETKTFHLYFNRTGIVEVTASEKEGGKWVNASARVYKVIDGEVDDSDSWYVGADKKKPKTRKLPVGKYMLKISYNDYKKQVPFEIKAGETTKVHVVMGQTGKVEVTASEKENGKWIHADCRAYRIIDGEIDTSDSWYIGPQKKKPGIKQLPVGEYRLKCSYNAFKKEATFKIKPEETIKVHIVMGQTGKVEVTASEKENGKWIDAGCRAYRIIDGEVDESDNWYIGPRKKKPGTKQLPVGEYSLKCEYNAFKKETKFKVKFGETTKVHVVMGQTGKVEVTASEKENGKWINADCRAYRIIDGEVDESDNWYIGPRKKKPGTKQLPAGKYVLRASYNGFEKEIPFEVKGGETTKVHVIFNKFLLGAKCTDMQEKVYYEVYASNGRLVYEDHTVCSKVLKLSLKEGTYNVEAKISSGKGEASFTVGAGNPSKLILDLTNLSHEEEIKADTPEEAIVVPVKPKVEKKAITIGDKKVVIEGMDPVQVEELQKAAQMVEMLGSMLNGVQQQKSVAPSQEEKEADKAFEEMSKDLDMFTK